MPPIRIHLLSDEVKTGLNVKHLMDRESWTQIEGFPVHRDDNYIFLLGENGTGSMDVDFNRLTLSKQDLYFLSPGQIHHNIKAREMTMWVILVAPELIPPDYLEAFESCLLRQKPCRLEEPEFIQCREVLHILKQQFESNPDNIYYKQLTHDILNAFLCIVARAYLSASSPLKRNISRPAQITQRFRKLLLDNFLSHKSPSYYAHQLNISQSYLNEAIKETTGFTVTYWIQQQLILEAKRLLCYSKLNVKEIAHALGYEDHTYFSKLFKRFTQMTPLAFRDDYLK